MMALAPDPDDLSRLRATLQFVVLTLPTLGEMGATPALLVRLRLLVAEGKQLLQTDLTLPTFTEYAVRLESAILAVNDFLGPTEE